MLNNLFKIWLEGEGLFKCFWPTVTYCLWFQTALCHSDPVWVQASPTGLLWAWCCPLFRCEGHCHWHWPTGKGAEHYITLSTDATTDSQLKFLWKLAWRHTSFTENRFNLVCWNNDTVEMSSKYKLNHKFILRTTYSAAVNRPRGYSESLPACSVRMNKFWKGRGQIAAPHQFHTALAKTWTCIWSFHRGVASSTRHLWGHFFSFYLWKKLHLQEWTNGCRKQTWCLWMRL